MTSFLRASAGLNRSWLCILAVAACLGWVQACTDPQDGAPEAWNSYEQNRDRKLSSDCAERPNFAFEVPSSWKLGEADCDSISFEAENDPAELRVVVLDLPDYPQNVEAALDRMQYRWSREENVAEDSVMRVEHHGSPAISRVHTELGVSRLVVRESRLCVRDSGAFVGFARPTCGSRCGCPVYGRPRPTSSH